MRILIEVLWRHMMAGPRQQLVLLDEDAYPQKHIFTNMQVPILITN